MFYSHGSLKTFKEYDDMPFNTVLSKSLYANFEYLEEGYGLHKISVNKLVPKLYKYNRSEKEYEICNIRSSLDEVCDPKLEKLFKNGAKLEGPDPHSRGMIKLNGVHYYINMISFPDNHVRCFVMKDITNDGPTKVFTPIQGMNKDKASYDHFKYLTLMKVENDLCYYTVLTEPYFWFNKYPPEYGTDKIYEMDLVSMYNGCDQIHDHAKKYTRVIDVGHPWSSMPIMAHGGRYITNDEVVSDFHHVISIRGNERRKTFTFDIPTKKKWSKLTRFFGNDKVLEILVESCGNIYIRRVYEDALNKL